MRHFIIVSTILGCAGLLAWSESPLSAARSATSIVASEDQCSAEFAAARTAVTDAEFLGKQADRDEASLLAKLDDAQAKLDAGKTADALGKLDDFRSKVIAFRDAPKPKIGTEDAQRLLDAVDALIACINSIG